MLGFHQLIVSAQILLNQSRIVRGICFFLPLLFPSLSFFIYIFILRPVKVAAQLWEAIGEYLLELKMTPTLQTRCSTPRRIRHVSTRDPMRRSQQLSLAWPYEQQPECPLVENRLMNSAAKDTL